MEKSNTSKNDILEMMKKEKMKGMGGRGSSSGVSVKGKAYGTEYTTLHESGNIKFVRYNDSKSSKTPIETMTNRRVYVTIDNRDNISAITYYDEENKRSKQIDLMHPHKNMIPHTHHGYLHNENDGAKGAANLTPKEKRMVESVTDKWYNKIVSFVLVYILDSLLYQALALICDLILGFPIFVGMNTVKEKNIIKTIVILMLAIALFIKIRKKDY